MVDFDDMYGSSEDLYYPKPTGMLAECLDSLGLNSGSAVDLGCGDGRNALELLRRGFDVTAVDVATVGLRKLRGLAASASFAGTLRIVEASVIDFSLPPQGLGVVVASTILCHLRPNEVLGVMSAIKGALRPGGLLYASVFTVDDPSFNPDSSKVDLSETSFGVINHFERNALLRMMEPLTVIRYREGVEKDVSHGEPHFHGIARAAARMGAM